jgi:hypothetical protein
MSASKGPWLTALAGLVVVTGLVLLAHWARGPCTGCELDGVTIDPLYRVEVIDSRGDAHGFCCPACARMWMARRPGPPRAITVTDEASGETLDAAAAVYVRSTVMTTPGTGNRIHAFRTRDDAEKHVERYGGRVLPDSENPLRVRRLGARFNPERKCSGGAPCSGEQGAPPAVTWTSRG